jgi:hypothetical protein
MVRTSDFETLRHPFSRGAHRWVPPVSARHVSTRRGSTVDIGAEDCLGVGSCGGCLGGLSRGVVLWRESRGGLSRNMSRGVVSGRESREGCLEVGVSGRGVAGQGWAALCKKRVPSERRGQGNTAGACTEAGQKREPQTEPGLLLMSGQFELWLGPMASSSQILPGQLHEDQNKIIKTLKHRCKVQVHYSTSECRNRVLRLTHVVSRHLLLPDLLVRSLSLYCQVNLCKGAGNFQSIIPHIRSFLCSIVKF